MKFETRHHAVGGEYVVGIFPVHPSVNDRDAQDMGVREFELPFSFSEPGKHGFSSADAFAATLSGVSWAGGWGRGKQRRHFDAVSSFGEISIRGGGNERKLYFMPKK